jgi:hypothetical protein
MELTAPRSWNRRRDIRPVQVFGGGANTEHFGGALKAVQQDRPVELFEVRPIDPDLVPHDTLHRLDNAEGQQSAEQAMGEKALAVYLSLVPHMHVDAIEKQLRRVGQGLLEFAVVPKPAVETIGDMKRVDAAIATAKEQQSLLDGGDAKFEPLFVHEHYIVKGAWSAFREQLGTIMDQLGRLESVNIHIEEARTVESEGRVVAFSGGALEDLGPHVTSLGLDIENAFDQSMRYSTSHRSKLELDRFRYDDSVLPDNVETGFIVNGTTTIIDNIDGNTPYELPFTWQGGKGLQDKKYVELAFVHPETDKHTKVVVNLQQNRLDVPDEIAHLFPQTQFSDNGYGDVVKEGLVGGRPNDSFQSWNDARKVVKIDAHIRRQNTEPPMMYSRQGQSLADLERQMSAA